MNNNFVKRALTSLYDKFAKEDNTTRLINYASTGCMILASVANLIGISIDKKTTKDEKMFLLPQEAADGVTSIVLYFTLSEGMRKAALRAVDSGQIAFKNITRNSPQFKKAREGMTLVASLCGSILASNIITPLVRNAIGARARNEMQKKTGKSAPKVPDNIVRPMPKTDIPSNIAHLHTTPIRMDRVQSGLRV